MKSGKFTHQSYRPPSQKGLHTIFGDVARRAGKIIANAVSKIFFRTPCKSSESASGKDPRSMPLRIQRLVADAVLACINRYFDRYTGGQSRPAFFDVTETAPSLKKLTGCWKEIRSESDTLVKGPPLPRYHDVDPHIVRISAHENPEKSWRVFLLHAMGETPDRARQRAPRTVELLKNVPDLYQAFFSVLAPGTSVPPHEGPYRGYLRYHLGLEVPQVNPPHIRVLNRKHVWKEGDDVLFDDSWEHEVVNNSTQRRVVLIVDILRPLPPLPMAINRWFVRRVIHPLYARRILQGTN